MADNMQIIITLRKQVPDRDTGHALYEQVKTFVAQYPDVKVTGHVSNHFDLDEET